MRDTDSYAGLQVAKKAKDSYGKLLVSGLTSLVLVQATINLFAVMGMAPLIDPAAGADAPVPEKPAQPAPAPVRRGPRRPPGDPLGPGMDRR